MMRKPGELETITDQTLSSSHGDSMKLLDTSHFIFKKKITKSFPVQLRWPHHVGPGYGKCGSVFPFLDKSMEERADRNSKVVLRECSFKRKKKRNLLHEIFK